MGKRFGMAAAVVLFVVLGVPTVAASASPLPDLTCGPITTSVRLRHDLNCPEGIQVADAADGTAALPAALTIDLGGHTLTQVPRRNCSPGLSATCATIYVSAEHTSVEIHNGTVIGGVAYADGNDQLTMDQPALGGIVNGVHAQGGVRLAGLLNDLRDSTVDGGVFTGGWGAQHISGNVIRDGISGEGDATIDHNVVFGAVQADDLCASRCGPVLTITHNLLLDSPGPGVSFDVTIGRLPRHIATISGNVIAKAAGAGISLLSDPRGELLPESYVVTNNLMAANGGDGLELVVAAGFGSPAAIETVKGNIAIGNGGHGFNLMGAPSGFTLEAQNNTAFANATDPQCIGLACRP